VRLDILPAMKSEDSRALGFLRLQAEEDVNQPLWFKRSVKEAADGRDDLRLFDLSDIVAVLESGTTH
jgi:hypothetical protein